MSFLGKLINYRILHEVYDVTVLTSTFAGSIAGPIYLHNKMYKDEKVFNALFGGIAGAGCGFVFGALSPISIPSALGYITYLNYIEEEK